MPSNEPAPNSSRERSPQTQSTWAKPAEAVAALRPHEHANGTGDFSGAATDAQNPHAGLNRGARKQIAGDARSLSDLG
ncbi:MAG: hypothetical protein RLZZ618_2949 [Pseudomonadota bacterium]|jgi:hypothetical protein